MASQGARRGESPVLAALADAVLQPGFVGTTLPEWVRRRLSSGLGGIALYSRNIVTNEQVMDLTAAIRAENPHVVIATDEEGGDVTRLEARTGSSRPGNLALGAADDPRLTGRVARGLGLELARAGVNLTYAPVVDIEGDLDNPVVGTRAFGSDPALAARHAAAWVTGVQSAGVAACAKHFPGHGATSADSHDELPTITYSAEDLARLALPPFRAAIDAGVRAVMTGHLLVPAYDRDSPATMSSRLLVELLRGELGFDGLIVTDGIEMAPVSGRYGLGGAAVKALAAGADAICVGGENASAGVVGLIRNTIMAAVMDGTLPEERLADAAARVRLLADWAHEHRRTTTPDSGTTTDTSTTTGIGTEARTGTEAGVGTGPESEAARRALRVTVNRRPRPGAPPHVIELASPTNLAVDPITPWGMADALTSRLPATTVTRLAEPDGHELLRAVEAARARLLVVTVRTAHRHAWVPAALDQILARRPDAVVVEMGTPSTATPGAIHIATHGATRVCARAAAEALADLGLLDPDNLLDPPAGLDPLRSFGS
ncbi:glycoside hydrolase family 3 N-terminal domain-containing protein [Nonomuraea mangrovi]|uniref:Glycoside hydrolase family 3 N-terminal domain-containing protein n=1 Tax=Nonomuraea mangrovi TaxID=2316207 RepID=A0ABW4SZB7_9ACTN